MRAALCAAAMLVVVAPLPVSAQEDTESVSPEPADRLSDPDEQEKLATMVGAMGDVLLSIDVGPLLDAMAKATGEELPAADENATLRAMAGPGADRIQDEIADKVPVMMDMMSGMVEGFEAMRPALEEMSDRMRERMDHRLERR